MKTQILIDQEDRHFLKEIHFWKSSGYLEGKVGGKVVRLHRIIMGNPKGIVDHINGNILDNRKKNLRVCSIRENVINQKKRVGTTSRYKGVSWSKASKKWLACINKYYKTYNLGYFENEKDAARKYNEVAKLWFGEFARVNQL